MTHVYLYVMDTIDKSTFSVRISPSKIIISPQIKCSGEALARFTDHLLKLNRNVEILSDKKE